MPARSSNAMASAADLLIPESRRPVRSSAWMRGITPARLGWFALICVMLAGRPALWNAEPSRAAEALQGWLNVSGLWLLFGFPLFILVIKAEVLTTRAAPRTRILCLGAAVLAGAAAFSFIPWASRVVMTPYLGLWQLSFFLRGLAIGGLLATVLYFASREADAQRELHRVRLARLDADRQAAEANLHRLRAQIEPHFLFNSLATIKRLYESDPGRARAMLRNLGNYVKVVTARAGRTDATLASEVALAKSFLDILQWRMGPRLQVRIEVPPKLASASVPTLMVATLVENAIKHGIAPRAAGGTVHISASCVADVLRIEVLDDGIGFREQSGRGVGLSNIRARLSALFGKSAGLDLMANANGGVRAMIWLPCRLMPKAP
jgi:sensor histidine kinase YesM